MYYHAFLGGLLAILTPGTFLCTLILLVGVNKVNGHGVRRIAVIAALCILVVLLFLLMGFLILDSSPDAFSRYASNPVLKYAGITLNIFLGLWLTGLFGGVSKQLESNVLFNGMAVVVMAVIFTAASFSSAGPIIGALLVSTIGSSGATQVGVLLVLFALGLVVPLCVVLLLATKFLQKHQEKNWLNTVRLLFGITVIVMTMVAAFN